MKVYSLLVVFTIQLVMMMMMIHAQTSVKLFVTYRDFQSKVRGFHPHFQNSAQGTVGTSNCNQMVSTKLVEEPGSGIYKPTICEPELRTGAFSGGDGPRCGTVKSNPTGTGTCFDDIDPSVLAQELEFSTWYRDNFDSTGNRSNLINKRSGQVLTLTPNPTVPGGFQFDSGAGFFPLPKGVNNEIAFDEIGDNDGSPDFNFYFTSEIHTFFEFKGGEVFNFAGDDDVWVYINDTLVLDIGGIHSETTRNLNLDSIVPPLVPGTIYPLSLFHAERRVVQSNFRLTTSVTSPCNAINKGVRQVTLPGAEFLNSMKLVGSSFVSNELVLVDGTVFNRVGYAFTKIQQNVGAGFISTFTFRAAANSQGFAFHAHDGSITDMNGGFGANLGIRNFQKSLAVVFDLQKKEIRVHATTGTNSVSDETKIAFAPLHPASNFADDLPYQVIIQSMGNPPVLEIYLDNSLYIQKRNFFISNAIGSRAAFIGFTATTGGSSATSGRVKITSWTLDTVTLQDNLTVPKTQLNITQTIVANSRDRARFLIDNIDVCGNPIDFGGFSNRLNVTFTALNGTNANATLNGTVIDANNGSYIVEFETDIVSDFAMNLTFGQNCAAQPQNCFFAYSAKAVSSTPVPEIPDEPATPEGLPDSALTAIGASIGVILFIGGAAGLFFLTKRNKWRREKQFIEAGKLAKLQAGLEMSGDQAYDEVARKLQETKEEINKRKGALLGSKNLDGDITRLEQQKNELQEQIREMKMKNQSSVVDSTTTSGPAHTGRKQFGAAPANF